MPSVADLVKETKESNAANEKRLLEYQAMEQKKKDSKQYSAEIAYIIKQFEFNVFKLDSPNKKVADFITERHGRFFITKADGCDQRMPGYIKIKPNLSQLKFYRSETTGRKYIGGSPKFNKWKKSLEDKFGVKINVEREYTYRDRYGNSGYATYPDQIFQGVLVWISLAKKGN